MIAKNSVVLYKKNPALIMETTGDKFTIQYCSQPATPTGKKAVYATQKVREKDFVVLSEDKATSIDAVLAAKADDFVNAVKEAWELLLSDEATASEEISFADVAAYALSELKADMSWAFYSALKNTFYFEEIAPLVFKPRSESAIDELIKKAESKGKEEELRAAFIERLKKRQLDLPADSKYMVDVEALALGKSDHSKTLHDAKITETPENAHKILLDTKIWDITRNPYPVRWGLSMQSATEGLASPPDEERLVVEGTSYAIDNAWSTDPDDAVAFDGTYLWVHIADPASTVRPDDKIDRIARDRGATLYIPEGASRMLSEDCLEDYALGLSEKSRALSFRILLDEKNAVADCQVFKTWVTVARLTYEMKKNKVKATFFVVGTMAKRNPKLVQREAREGHLVASHSWAHGNLSLFSKKNLLADQKKVFKLIKKLTGAEPTLMRPPYGAVSAVMKKNLATPMVTWDVDPKDWRDSLPCESVCTAAV